MMAWGRPAQGGETVLEDLAVFYSEYSFLVNVDPSTIDSITLDKNNATADINKNNNQLKEF